MDALGACVDATGAGGQVLAKEVGGVEKGGGGAGKEAWGWIGKGFLFAGAGRGPGPWSARALRAPIFSLSQNSRLRGLLPSGMAHFSNLISNLFTFQ